VKYLPWLELLVDVVVTFRNLGGVCCETLQESRNKNTEKEFCFD
jgi:hypothetical protein